jgi:phosphatidylglycerol:prolipoprotein diacylglycerol transferase
MAEILFQYGPFIIPTLSLFAAIGFLLSMMFLLRYIGKTKLNLSFFSRNALWFFLAILLGGRIVYGIEHFESFKLHPLSFLYIWDLKLSTIGAFAALSGTLFYLARKEKENFWAWLDAFILTGLLALTLFHLGTFFSGHYYGKPTDLPWGMRFDASNIPFTRPIHPTQLYSTAAAFIAYALGRKISKRSHLPGVAGFLALMLYSVSAFGIDFLHNVSSVFSKTSYLIIAIVAFVGYVHCSHQKLRDVIR